MSTFTLEIPGAQMIADGWHHKSDCPARIPVRPTVLSEAIADLHRQAHPDQPADAYACNREPCCRLSLAQITGRSAA